MAKSTPWTEGEQAAVISLYFKMLAAVKAGQKYNKAQMIRNVQNGGPGPDDSQSAGPLKARSRGSVELKLMNVTAACEALGHDDLSMAEHGYRPLTNMQKSLKTAVKQHIDWSFADTSTQDSDNGARV